MTLTEARVSFLPECDLCKVMKADKVEEAAYDGATVYGPWAFMCEEHFATYGMGLGTGRGQRLVTE